MPALIVIIAIILVLVAYVNNFLLPLMLIGGIIILVGSIKGASR